MGELIYKDPLVQFVTELNQINPGLEKIPVTSDDLIITELKSEGDNQGKREVELNATKSSKYHGTVDNPGVTYSRYDWDRLFKQVPVIYMTGKPTIRQVLNTFSERYNIPPFTFEGAYADFSGAVALDDEIVYNEENWADLGYGFANTSIGYTGMFKLRVYDDVYNLPNVILKRDLNVLRYPDNTKGESGSLSLLTTPVKFVFEKDKIPILSKVGAGLNGYLIESIAKQVAAYYNNPTGLEKSIKDSIAKHTVRTTNVSSDGTSTDGEPLLVTLYGSTAFVNWIGTVILNITEFN